MIKKGYMRSAPERYGNKQHLGWQAYRKYSPILDQVVSSSEIAKKACETKAGHALEWIQSSKPNIFGHYWYDGRGNDSLKSEWSVSSIYKDVREVIPGAEFISDDLTCWYYVAPEKSGWSVNLQIDLEGRDPFDMWLRGGAQGHYFQSIDDAKLWNFYQCNASSKEEAIQFGYYLWAKDLVTKIEPPAHKNSFLQKVRNLARKFI